MVDDHPDEFERHLRAAFVDHEITHTRYPVPPAQPRLHDLAVLEIAPGPHIGLWTYVTLGASAVVRDGLALEFFLCASQPDRAHVELVTMVAHYHAIEPSGLFGPGHMLPVGRPWLPGSACSRVMTSLPYPLPPRISRVERGPVTLELSWLLPITDAEARFGREHGLETLEERFESAALQYWDPTRASVV